MVSPTKNLLRLRDSQETTQASSLLMHAKKCDAKKAHFARSSLPSDVTATIRERLKADLQDFTATDEHDGRIYKALSEILVNKTRLVRLGWTEAAIRYAMCDPLMSMVCDCYKFTLKLEESVKEEEGEEAEDESAEAVLVDLRVLWQDEDPLQQQSAGSGPLPSSSEGTVEEASMDVDDEEARAGPSETGRHSIGGAMSTTSKADYAVYTLGHGSQSKVVAIIDAKKHITPHSIAQVIGYYSAFKIGEPRPLVLVLTAYELTRVIFPFQDGSKHVVNAVELQEFKLWKREGRMLDFDVLNVLLSLMNESSRLRNYSIEAMKANIPIECAMVSQTKLNWKKCASDHCLV